jgi:hypothetical protein
VTLLLPESTDREITRHIEEWSAQAAQALEDARRKDALVGASGTVALDDYARAQRERLYLQGIDAGGGVRQLHGRNCAEDASGRPKGKDGQAGMVHMYFDRNEKFMHKLNAPWLQRRKRSRLDTVAAPFAWMTRLSPQAAPRDSVRQMV